MEYVLLLAILVVCVYKYGKFGAWGKNPPKNTVSNAPRVRAITSKSETGDYSKNVLFFMRRSEEPGHEPTIDQLLVNEVVVSNADDCFYKNVDGVIVKYTRAS